MLTIGKLHFRWLASGALVRVYLALFKSHKQNNIQPNSNERKIRLMVLIDEIKGYNQCLYQARKCNKLFF